MCIPESTGHHLGQQKLAKILLSTATWPDWYGVEGLVLVFETREKLMLLSSCRGGEDLIIHYTQRCRHMNGFETTRAEVKSCPARLNASAGERNLSDCSVFATRGRRAPAELFTAASLDEGALSLSM